MFRRLSFKLVVSLVAIVAIVGVVGSFINLRLQERQILDSMVRGADQLSKSITSATWHAMLADRRMAAYEVMQTIATQQGIHRIRIFNKEGRVMFSTGPEAGTLVDKRAEACFVCHAQDRPHVRVDAPARTRIFQGEGGRRQLAMITPIYNESACSRAACHAHPAGRSVLGVLDISLDLGPLDRELAGMKLRALLVSGVEILVLGTFVVFFTRRFVEKPIRKLIDATKAVSEMRLERPIEVDSSEELGELARSFNSMQERLGVAVGELNELTHGLENKVKKRTEQLRTAQDKLIRSDRLASLGQLAASVAHEINNPIAGVLNLSMLMQRILKDDGIPRDRVQEFRLYLAQVASETARVGHIVSDLLAFSRRPKPQRGPADVNAIVRSTLSLVGHKMELADIRTEADIAEDLPRVSCDASQIQQVVMNLVLNAAEATAAGGTVSVSTRPSRDGGAVVLEVRDAGAGIPPEILPRIFDPFFSTKEDGKSTGLGLAVVYGIVHAHGGDVEVESRVGEGSTFRVTIPRTPPDIGAGAAAAESSEGRGRG